MDRGLDREQNVVERLVGRLKGSHRIATRYDKLATSYPPACRHPNVASKPNPRRPSRRASAAACASPPGDRGPVLGVAFARFAASLSALATIDRSLVVV
jgi:hypothetical protein